ncbi:phage baseplate assembly protein V [Fulvivirga sediminis]|uniref:Gp5/Type VI secretion system Vgr protein OB-fold domain-containing protein n=1 Tax=Fulvivirga sediminis TaxID=2803949 RepID=A0A937JYC6_9BACT|nr:phage baseplate assembly protein V [Fulvivirga sediminis]MBL3655539.1 hypothetical protein [Fulvivirga sediminis]
MSVVSVILKSDGKVVKADHQLIYLDIVKEFNKIPLAELRFKGGDISRKEFEILDEGWFDIGKKVDVAVSYADGTEKEEFSGIVVNHSLELSHNAATLMVELSGKAIAMTKERHHTVFNQEKDEDIINKIIGKYKPELVSKVATTTQKHPEMVQYYVSDWDFMLCRAAANGQLVYAENDRVSTIIPKIDGQDNSLELGMDQIYDFDLQVDGRSEYNKGESVGWEAHKQELAKAKTAKVQSKPTAIDNTWSKAREMKSTLALMRGSIKLQGSGKWKVGQVLKIAGFSKKYSGANIITGIRHQLSVQNWTTHLQLGMDAEWLNSQIDFTDSHIGGVVPAINGLQTGVIRAFEKDPNNEWRVKVYIPAFGAGSSPVWARYASPDAGDERGFFFRPELDDEVVIGFLNDDPLQPIILGAMHSAANKPPVKVSKENAQKGIITKSGYKLLFDDVEKTILLSGKNNRIYINDEEGTISMDDAHGNQLLMGSDGITINSSKDLKMTAKGNLSIEAKKNISIKGKKVDLI